MRRVFIIITCVVAFIYFSPLGCTSDEIQVSQRQYDPQAGRFVVEGDVQGEFHHYDFRLEDEKTVEKLSFGVRDLPHLANYSVVKGIHILSDSAAKTYQEEYLRPGKNCPASFMNQNLETLMLLPVDEKMAAKLEMYDIPFDGRGAPFRLRGHYMHSDGTYFMDGDKRHSLRLPTHESVMSNFGSASHAMHYFLVTEVEPGESVGAR